MNFLNNKDPGSRALIFMLVGLLLLVMGMNSLFALVFCTYIVYRTETNSDDGKSDSQ
jgi:hypothetical protein